MKFGKIYCVSFEKENRTKLKRNARKKNWLNLLNFVAETSNMKKSQNRIANSHLKAITEAKDKKEQHILIISDNSKFLVHPFSIPDPPKDYGVCYLIGDTLKQEKFTKETKKDKYWNIGEFTGTEAYIVSNKIFDKLIEEAKKSMKDTILWSNWLTEFCRENEIKTYLQKEYIITTNNIEKTPHKLHQINMIKEEGEDDTVEYSLELDKMESYDDLPKISLITPIQNPKFFFMLLMNFYKLDYPKDKLEWVIVDDTPEHFDASQGGNTITSLIPPEEERIKYLRCNVKDKQRISLGKKLNLAINYASNDYFIHFFEKNYYPYESIMVRTRALMSYEKKGVHCIGSTDIGVYNYKDNVSFINETKDIHDHKTILYEPSMAYTRSFWEFMPFNEFLLNDNHRNIVSIPFTTGRYNLLLDIPYHFTTIALTGTVKPENKTSEINFRDSWDPKMKDVLNIVIADMMKEQEK